MAIMPHMKCPQNVFALGIAAALVSALSMLILGISGNLSIYSGAVEMMRQWHMFFSLTPMGILTGMLEAAGISLVFCIIWMEL